MQELEKAAEHTEAEIALAKTEALDKFLADNIEEFASSWDLNFIASIKDWQYKYNRKLSPKQLAKLLEIYQNYATDIDFRGFEGGGKYDYKNYLR